MTYQAKPPSVVVRDALRAALRQHPNSGRVLQGRLVGTLSNAELRNGLFSLGLDPDAIRSAALAGDGCDIPPHPLPGLHDEPTEDPAHASEPSDAAPPAGEPDPIETEIQTIRRLFGEGDYTGYENKLRELVTLARKPAEVIEVPAPMPGQQAIPPVVSRWTGRTETWNKLFQVTGPLGDRECAIWDGKHKDTPKVNPDYIFPQGATEVALTQLAHDQNVFIYGPKGCGKTEFARQFAARTGRPLALISCDESTDGPTLLGMTIPNNGSVSFQLGALAQAIQIPGCLVAIDEPSTARAGALMVFQNLLEFGELWISETGQRIPIAKNVLFMAMDNTNGTGRGARQGYTGTHTLNAAFLDRFGPMIKCGYLPARQEVGLLCKTVKGCTKELAKILVKAANITRAAAENETLVHGIGFRRLRAWAQMLVDGIDAEYAFQCAVLNFCASDDVETVREQCLLAYDKAGIHAALHGTTPAADPAQTNPTVAGRIAAATFA